MGVNSVASTDTAATLLLDGRTYHSLFKVPVPFNESSVSSMDANSYQAHILRNCRLIIWDEN
jgi:hypothetical protein